MIIFAFLQLPWAMLDYCELSAILRAKGEEEDGDREKEEQFRERAEKMVTQFGDGSVFRYKKKCLRLSQMAPVCRKAETKLACKEPGSGEVPGSSLDRGE